MMMRPKQFWRLGLTAVLGAAFSLPPRAWAQPSPNERATAQALFDEARQLASQGNFPQACPKFQESQRLDPGMGTLYNLADCYEHIGRTASAWAAFREVADTARLAQQPERERVATQRASALEPRLAKLTIEVPADSTVPGLEVRRDGLLIGTAQWGAALPVDPGSHQITASAPGKRNWAKTISIPTSSGVTVVSIPLLAPGESPKAGVATTDQAASSSPPPPVPPGSVESVPAGTEPRRGQGQRITGLVLGGVGLVGLGVGTAFALSARSKYEDSKDFCSPADANRCTPRGVSERNDARDQGNLATYALGAGAAVLVGGAILWLTAPSADPAPASASRRSWQPTAALSPHSATFVVQGAW